MYSAGAAALLAALLLTPTSALARVHRPRQGHGTTNAALRHSRSENWSGYAATGEKPFTSVAASWVVPAVNCAVTPKSSSSFWVGLDGDTDATVEQTGTEGSCTRGRASYGGWYELFPAYPVNFPTGKDPVRPGDVMSASVTYVSRKYRMRLEDVTERWSVTATKGLKRAKRLSAEIIAEAPSEASGPVSLADFGSVSFTKALMNGKAITDSTPGIEPITMGTRKVTEATPTALAEGAFGVTWEAA
jgi:hypothetical protein